MLTSILGTQVRNRKKITKLEWITSSFLPSFCIMQVLAVCKVGHHFALLYSLKFSLLQFVHWKEGKCFLLYNGNNFSCIMITIYQNLNGYWVAEMLSTEVSYGKKKSWYNYRFQMKSWKCKHPTSTNNTPFRIGLTFFLLQSAKRSGDKLMWSN